MSRYNQKKGSGWERLATGWGGTLGFVVGAALTAWLGKLAGWWPPASWRLQTNYQEKNNEKTD